MAKKAKKGNGKAKGGPKDDPNLDALHKSVLDADAVLTKAGTEAETLVDKALDVVAEAMRAYREAARRYWEACRKAGVECEFAVGGLDNASPKLTFIVEKADNGVSVLVKGRPKPEEIVPLAILRGSINRATHSYTVKHVRPRERASNKAGTLGRLRAPKVREK